MLKSRNRLAVKGNKLISNRVNELSAQPGVLSRPELASTEETAYLPSPMSGNTSNSISISAIGTGAVRQLDLLLSGFIDERNKVSMRTLYRDIYYYDVICGSAADMTSTLPFSDFTLVGLEEKKIQVYNDSVDRLNLKTMFPEFSLGYLVDAVYLATLVYSTRDKIFTDLLPHDIQNCTLEDLPFASQDPLIKVRQSEELKRFLYSEDPIAVKQRRNYSPKLLNELNNPEFSLDPLTTIYLPRKGLRGKPNSYFRRVLPIYLLEKMLLRGTLVEASKRQRSALHVAAGGDTWEPTPQELVSLVNLFQQADFDPLGPIVATRNDVQANEIRQGGEFWKYTDIADQTNQWKLRALGISENFLSGEQSYATAEASLSVYIENMRAYRDFLTQQVFYRKMFPIIAHVNGFFKESDNRVVKADTLLHKINDSTRYEMPQVRWHKSLQPHSDRDTFDLLNDLAEKGVPVTLRMWAAAGGVNIDNIKQEVEEDKKLRTELIELTKGEVPPGAGGAGDSGGDFEMSSLKPIKKVGFYNRYYGEMAEVVGQTKTGKKKRIVNQLAAIRKQNELIMKALGNLKDPNHFDKVVKNARKRMSASEKRGK